jgi:two-component sensor histidine kinase
MREIIWKRLPSLYIDVPALRPGTVGAYALAFVCDGVAARSRSICCGCALQLSASKRSGPCGPAKIVCSCASTQPASGGGSTIRSGAPARETHALTRFTISILPRTRRWRSKSCSSGCIRTTLVGSRRQSLRRSTPPIRSHTRMSTGFGGETAAREEREHLLMREINHRAKNMLSVVDAIARQTATRTPEDFVERFSDRIQALAANQDLLIRNACVRSRSMICAQLAPFADLIGSRIVMLGPKLRLNAATAQAIGLALHELPTNAGKYGALSMDTGRLHVGWWTEGETFTIALDGARGTACVSTTATRVGHHRYARDGRAL